MVTFHPPGKWDGLDKWLAECREALLQWEHTKTEHNLQTGDSHE